MILKKCLLGMAMLVLLLMSTQAFAQSSAITGIVTDPSNLVIQGAKVTATNEATGAKNEVTTNNSGVYNLLLPVGKYTIAVETANFSPQSRKEVELLTGSQLRVNFQMQVKEQKIVLDVNVKNENLILDSGSSGATVLTEDQLASLPLYNNNVMDLVKLMGGVEYASNQIFSSDDNTLAGIKAAQINVSINGISASEVRRATGFSTAINLNPDLVSEFKVVMQPVDAELGHGAGQIMVTTRSGTNAYRGSANWNIGNSALNSNTWANNKTIPKTMPTWNNRQNVSVNVGGPIIKNKTQFFVLFEWNSNMTKNNNQYTLMPTKCARKGIYRYFEGYANQYFLYNPTDPTYPQIANSGTGNINSRIQYYLSRSVVDWEGKPVSGLPLPMNVKNETTGLYGTYLGSTTTLTGAPAGTANGFIPADATHANQVSRLMAVSPFGVIKPSKSYMGGTGSWDPAVDIDCKDVQVITDKNSPMYGLANSDWVDYTGAWATTNSIIKPTYAQTGGSSWDNYRDPDQSGYVSKFMDLTQSPNVFDQAGDGLNWGRYRWTRRNEGNDNINGIGEAPNRKQLTVRIDHTINTRNRLNGSWTYERNRSTDAAPTMPTNSYTGTTTRTPQQLSATLTTTVKPNFLNELRVGLSYSSAYSNAPADDPETGEELRKLLYNMLPTADWPGFQGIKNQNIPVFVALPNFGFSATNYNPVGSGRGTLAYSFGSSDPRWSYTDTVTLTIGRHSLRFGGETQRTKSDYRQNGASSTSVYPVVTGGTPSGALTGVTNTGLYNATTNVWTLPGSVGSASYAGNIGGLQTLMNLFSGSVSQISQYFFINEPTATRYNQVTDGELWRKQYFRQNTMSFFLQDNWRLTDDLTLNLGMRYEWYGVPYNANGMTAGYIGGAGAALGLSGRNLTHWLNLPYNPMTSTDPTDAYKNCTDSSGKTVVCDLTKYAFIGPDSPNPDTKIYNNDWNNFGPVFGFAYSLPWGGKGKTVLRGGIQLSYTSFGRAGTSLPDIPGVASTGTYNNGGAYMDLSTIKNIIPISLSTSILPPARANEKPTPQDYHQGTLNVWDPNIRTPYTEGVNLSLQRTIGSSMTLELRYSGNLSHKQTAQINLNSVNMLSTGLVDAFVQARAGGNPALLDKMLKGVNIGGATSTNTATTWGRIGVDINPRTGEVFHAGEQMRNSSYLAAYTYPYAYTCLAAFWWGPGGCLASGYYGTLAGWMATANLNTAWNSVPYVNTTNARGQMLRVAGMPDNILTANPQFGTVNWTGNFNDSNYHSGQAQLQIRPTHGLGMSFQFTWSKSMGLGSPQDFSNRDLEYGVNSESKSIQSYGTFDLPFGPNRWLFSNVSPNILGRIIGGWQLSWVHTMSTGSLMNVASNYPYLWGSQTQPLINGPFDNKSGYAEWRPGAPTGQYYGGKYTWGYDPQCKDPKITATSIQSACNMSATTLLDGTVVFANPVAGTRGNFTRNQLMGPSNWSTDGAMSKSFRLTEGKTLQLRVDASNIFNHAQVGSPDVQVGNVFAAFGQLTTKSGQRKFQARVRIDF